MTAHSPVTPQPKLPPISPVRLNMALAGKGPALDALADLVGRQDFIHAFPGFCITGMLGMEESHSLPLSLNHLPRYANITDLLQAHPATTTVVDMTDSGMHMAVLREQTPTPVAVLHAPALMTFLQIITSEQLCQSCRINLIHARTLFASLIDQIDEEILLLDLESRIVDLNKNVLDKRGGSKEYWIGRYCRQLASANFCTSCQGVCPLQEVLRTGNKAEQVHTHIGPDGTPLHMRIYAYPVYDQNGKLKQIIEIRRDITKRTNIERKLHQAKKMAAIGELSTYLAHEIRNPLVAIGGFANALLRSPSLDAQAREKVGIILEEARRLETFLRNTMDFARPSTPEQQAMDLNTLVREVMELMARNSNAESITTKLELAESLPPAYGDADMLKQSLINLVKNAQEAMPKGGTLTVRTGTNNAQLFIQVQDTGNGIAEHVRERIFSPFFSTKPQGAGLGLAMSKKLLESMGGNVMLESASGKGTCIILLMPSRPGTDTSDFTS